MARATKRRRHGSLPRSPIGRRLPSGWAYPARPTILRPNAGHGAVAVCDRSAAFQLFSQDARRVGDAATGLQPIGYRAVRRGSRTVSPMEDPRSSPVGQRWSRSGEAVPAAVTAAVPAAVLRPNVLDRCARLGRSAADGCGNSRAARAAAVSALQGAGEGVSTETARDLLQTMDRLAQERASIPLDKPELDSWAPVCWPYSDPKFTAGRCRADGE